MSAARKPSTPSVADDIWAGLVRSGPIRSIDLAQELGVHPTTASKRLKKLLEAGRARQFWEDGHLFWAALEDRAQGDAVAGLSQTGAIWRVMRAHKGFAVTDIHFQLAASYGLIPEAEIERYVQALLAAGYLRVLERADRSRGIVARYRLVQDTGPLPPAVERRVVVRDQNEDRVRHVQGARL